MIFVPSEHQKAVFKFVESGNGSAVVKAVAGSGKTTTVVQSLKGVPVDKKAQIIAFNKNIAQELQRRVPPHIYASTFHSVGYRAIGNKFKNGGTGIKVEGDKVRSLFKASTSNEDFKSYAGFVPSLVSLAKNYGLGTPDGPSAKEHETWGELVDHFDLSTSGYRGYESEEEGIRMAMGLLVHSNKRSERGEIDFDDMIYLPSLWDLNMYWNDFVFVDEAQDTNPMRRNIIRKVLGRNGRLIAVGDPRQAIYGFQGASHDSINQIMRQFNCRELPLTVSFRCPQAVVRLAQTLVPYIEAHKDAPEGEVLRPDEWRRKDYAPTDAILCRLNAPLMKEAMRLMAEGIGCQILGADIGKGMVDLINKMRASNLTELEVRLHSWSRSEYDRLIMRDKKAKAQRILDKVEAIGSVVEGLEAGEHTVEGVMNRIKRMFTDNAQKGLLTLSTVHKAKGREWKRVFILKPELMPFGKGLKEWQLEQEFNLMYVAYTRAMETLVFLPREE